MIISQVFESPLPRIQHSGFMQAVSVQRPMLDNATSSLPLLLIVLGHTGVCDHKTVFFGSVPLSKLIFHGFNLHTCNTDFKMHQQTCLQNVVPIPNQSEWQLGYRLLINTSLAFNTQHVLPVSAVHQHQLNSAFTGVCNINYIALGNICI